MKPLIITQARMSSSRLPGKILMTVKGKSLLQYHIDGLKKCHIPIVIATTTNSADHVIEVFSKESGLHCFRGDELDVLSRYYYAAVNYDADVIIRVTSDCPLIDGDLITEGYETYADQNDDQLFLSNTLERTFPRGFDYAIFSKKMLVEAHQLASSKYEREHVTPYSRENKSNRFKLHNILSPINYNYLRVTLDTLEDFNLIKKIIEKYHGTSLGYKEVLKLLSTHPDLIEINKNVKQKE